MNRRKRKSKKEKKKYKKKMGWDEMHRGAGEMADATREAYICKIKP